MPEEEDPQALSRETLLAQAQELRERIADLDAREPADMMSARTSAGPRATRRWRTRSTISSIFWTNKEKTVQPGTAAPFFFYCSPNSSRTICMRIRLSPIAREEAEKAGDRRILEVVVA